LHKTGQPTGKAADKDVLFPNLQMADFPVGWGEQAGFPFVSEGQNIAGA